MCIELPIPYFGEPDERKLALLKEAKELFNTGHSDYVCNCLHLASGEIAVDLSQLYVLYDIMYDMKSAIAVSLKGAQTLTIWLEDHNLVGDVMDLRARWLNEMIRRMEKELGHEPSAED